MEFIQWLIVFLTVFGILGLVFKNKISMMIGKLGSPLGLSANLTLIILSVGPKL